MRALAQGVLLSLAALLPLGALAGPVCTAVVQHKAPPLNSCIGSARVKIAAVGDVLLHRPLQRRGYSDPDGFYAIWRAVAPIFRAADIAYANLEGPVAPGVTRGGNNTRDPGPVFDDRVYSSFPQFNYHPRVITDLMRAGVNLVSTANNHSMDRGVLGADRTIDSLRAARLRYFGTVKTGEARSFVAYTPSRLGRIAWIACSYSTNGLRDPNNQVLMCFEDREALLTLVARNAGRSDVAGVIVTPHWGFEYQHSPNARQRALARDLVGAGATAVIGTHPHVVQPWEYVRRSDGSQGLVIYSTGNFVSGQVSLSRRTGGLAWLELCRPRPPKNLASALRSKLVIANSGWVPVIMNRTALGPELQAVTAAEPAGSARDALRLVTRHWPPNGIRVRVACNASDATLVALQ
ncbi:Capsule biosynthesis protein capA [Candidatus Rhodobacter oscarellae]|uniref:Capsule biosynthesis protein capA n=1 Tax=Candidatus Rhodobacter oscarellae TaxID=1675527 RepID=A0A0J9GWM6_9RHOB|nr:CapA family protein [Candidatus Rhodobacter lobularis]KMW57943.1 Capsule biosynthesis protein capA [Candidatus Rhodobacter lobularis]